MEMETGQATILEMKKENSKELAQLIKTVVFKDFGTIRSFEKGLKFTVDDGACQQANAYLDSSFFSNFKVKEENVIVKIPIKTLFEFLSIPESTTSSVKFTYSGMFEPLKLLIEEPDGCIIRAKIHTCTADQELDFEFQDSTVLASYMLKTQVLKEIFKDFDDSSRRVKMEFTKSALNFSTFGEVGEITVSIPSRSLQMETMKCCEEVSFSYQLSLLQRMNPAMILASKVVIRVDERGVLCCQFTVEHGENRVSYIEFLTVPNDDSEEEEE